MREADIEGERDREGGGEMKGDSETDEQTKRERRRDRHRYYVVCTHRFISARECIVCL